MQMQKMIDEPQVQKWILASKTFWGALLVFLVAVVNAFGHSIAPETLDAINAKALAVFNAIGALAGPLLVIWGLVTSQGPKSITPPTDDTTPPDASPTVRSVRSLALLGVLLAVVSNATGCALFQSLRTPEERIAAMDIGVAGAATAWERAVPAISSVPVLKAGKTTLVELDTTADQVHAAFEAGDLTATNLLLKKAQQLLDLIKTMTAQQAVKPKETPEPTKVESAPQPQESDHVDNDPFSSNGRYGSGWEACGIGREVPAWRAA